MYLQLHCFFQAAFYQEKKVSELNSWYPALCCYCTVLFLLLCLQLHTGICKIPLHLRLIDTKKKKEKKLHNQLVDFVGELPAEKAWHTISGRYNGYLASGSKNLNGIWSVQLNWRMIITDVFDLNNVICNLLPLCCQAKEGAFMVRDSRHAGVYTVSVFTRTPG